MQAYSNLVLTFVFEGGIPEVFKCARKPAPGENAKKERNIVDGCGIT
jgi:hypothetical protein